MAGSPNRIRTDLHVLDGFSPASQRRRAGENPRTRLQSESLQGGLFSLAFGHKKLLNGVSQRIKMYRISEAKFHHRPKKPGGDNRLQVA